MFINDLSAHTLFLHWLWHSCQWEGVCAPFPRSWGGLWHGRSDTRHADAHVFIQSHVDGYLVVSKLGMLQIKLLWTSVYKFRSEWLDRTAGVCGLTFRALKLFLQSFVPFYIYQKYLRALYSHPHPHPLSVWSAFLISAILIGMEWQFPFS